MPKTPNNSPVRVGELRRPAAPKKSAVRKSLKEEHDAIFQKHIVFLAMGLNLTYPTLVALRENYPYPEVRVRKRLFQD